MSMFPRITCVLLRTNRTYISHVMGAFVNGARFKIFRQTKPQDDLVGLETMWWLEKLVPSADSVRV